MASPPGSQDSFPGSLVSPAGSSVRGGSQAFTDELKLGLSVLLHVSVGRVEPATVQLDEQTGKLVVKTNREGWRAWCYCYNRRYELAKGELEPLVRTVHTRRLISSVNVINGGDARMSENMLQRSLSLLRRYPQPESVDMTFFSLAAEERLRVWANDVLSVNTKGEFRRSSKHIIKALEGHSPSDTSDVETTVSEERSSHRQLEEEDKPGLPPIMTRAATVHPASRRRGPGSGAVIRSQSMHNTGATRAASSETPEPEESDRDKHFWTWKEPPVLRRMDTLPGSGAGRGRHRMRRSTTPRGDSTRRDSAPPLARAPTEETPPPKHRRGDSEPKGDFWDPLGLLSDINPGTPRTPAAAKARPSPRRAPRARSVPPEAEQKKPKDGNTE